MRHGGNSRSRHLRRRTLIAAFVAAASLILSACVDYATPIAIDPTIYEYQYSSFFGTGLDQANQSWMKANFGNPGQPLYGDDSCSPTSSLPAGLRSQIVTEDVGPFNVTGLNFAVDGLRDVLDEVRTVFPDLYPRVRTMGMLCFRYVRGSSSTLSNHSWGAAVDLRIDPGNEYMGDYLAQWGLVLLARTFNDYGWYWGGGFSGEDAMHFELSQQVVLFGLYIGQLHRF